MPRSMASTDLLLSEVHIGASSHVESPISTRFNFVLPAQQDGPVEQDEDGDLIVPRARRVQITINHLLSTTLQDVGLQVWRGALLLSDFILSHPDLFRGKCVCELGSGVGLVSIVLASAAELVYCTDVGASLLRNCASNIEVNAGVGRAEVRVRTLDWCAAMPFVPASDSDPFGWTPEDIQNIQGKVDVYVAADVIYDDALTDAFVTKVLELLPPHGVLYLALEKRINFSMDDLAVAAHARDYFLDRLRGTGQLQGDLLDVDFPQAIDYERTPDLELFEIRRRGSEAVSGI